MCVYSFVQWSCGCYCWLLQWIQLFWSRVLAQITRKTESVASTTRSCLFSVLHSISIWKPSKISSNLWHSHPDWKKNSYLSWLCPGVPVCILWVRVVEVVGSQNCHWLFICSPHNSTFHAAHWGGGGAGREWGDQSFLSFQLQTVASDQASITAGMCSFTTKLYILLQLLLSDGLALFASLLTVPFDWPGMVKQNERSIHVEW